MSRAPTASDYLLAKTLDDWLTQEGEIGIQTARAELERNRIFAFREMYLMRVTEMEGRS